MGIEIIGGDGLNLGRRLKPLHVVSGGWRDVSLPDATFSYVPFTIEQNGRSFRPKSDWDISSLAVTGKAYYVSTTGSDSNNGLTSGAPFRNVRTALTQADIKVLYVEAGVYGSDYGWWTTGVAKDLSVIAYGAGKAIMSGHWAGLAWALDETLTHTYKVARTNIGAIYDASVVDANGDYSKLALQSNAAAVEANPGSWYTDLTTAYVRLADSRVPDVDCRPMVSIATHSFSGAFTLYCENIEFHGFQSCHAPIASAGPASPTCYYKNCAFKYATGGNGLNALGATTYLQNCLAARNYDDGFNYHVGTTVIPTAIEINCIGRDNGQAADLDNGSTIHDAGRIVRLMGDYMRNVGRNVHDVTSGTKSWNLGCNSHDSASAVYDSNFAAGLNVDGTEMWLDSCQSSGGTYDIEASQGSTVHVRNFNGDATNTGAGTISAY